MFYILQWGGRDGDKTVGYNTGNLRASGVHVCDSKASDERDCGFMTQDP